MSIVTTTIVPAGTVRDVTAFARTLVSSVRTRKLYSAEHPAVATATERLRSALAALAGHSGLELGITPAGLLANGEALPVDPRVAEAATLLHERDILRLRCLEPPALSQVNDFLQLLAFDGNDLRRQGGPGHMWEGFGHRWLEIDQIDYDTILRDAAPGSTAPGRPSGSGSRAGSADVHPQDDVWTSLVRSIVGGRRTLETEAQKRLVDIARSAESVRELAAQTSAALAGPDKAALAAAQAATVLATFDRLVDAVRNNAPDDLSLAVKNVAKAASDLDPALVMRAVGESAESGLGAELTATLGQYFDDNQVARMLARSMAAEGRATGRMAAALTTLTPDADRRDRVLRLARNLTEETGKSSNLESMWGILQQFMSGPAENVYVSDGYSATLEQAETRSQRLTLDIPPELDRWMQTVASDSVRNLSVTLLLDLFAIESESASVTETANDLAGLAGDLLLSADLDVAHRIVAALQEAGNSGKSARALAARLALESIATSEPLADVLSMAGDFDGSRFGVLVHLCLALGPTALRPIVSAYASTSGDEVRARLRELLHAYGETATSALGRLALEEDWPVARAAIQLLGGSASPTAVTFLQPIAKDPDLRKAREAIVALIRQQDPSAAKTVSRILSMGDRPVRQMAVEALAASRDRRASPILAGLLPQLNALGADFDLALSTLTALRMVGDDSAVDSLAALARQRRWFAWTRTKTLRQTAVDLLAHLKSPAAAAALDDLSRRGDRQTRRMARHAQRGAA